LTMSMVMTRRGRRAEAGGNQRSQAERGQRAHTLHGRSQVPGSRRCLIKDNIARVQDVTSGNDQDSGDGSRDQVVVAEKTDINSA